MRNTSLSMLLTLFGLSGCLPDLKDDTAPMETGPDTDDTQPPASDQDGDGFTVEDGDCNDGDASIHPDAPDSVGDFVDQNCDGIDGVDQDGDGFASIDSDGDDCDDTDAAVNPDGFDWNDGKDNDCYGMTDSISTGQADGRWVGTMSGALVGAAIAGAGDVDGDGKGDVLVSAVEDPDSDGDGAAYLLLGPASFEQEVQAADARLLGAAVVSNAWPAVSAAGDLDRDGYGDILVGASGVDQGATNSGAVYMVRGPVAGDLYLSGANATLNGLTGSDSVGRAVAGGKDVDGDELADFVVGAPGWGVGETGRGAVFLVTTNVSGESSIETDHVRVNGESSNDSAGWSLALVDDTNGDGFADILVGAPYESTLAQHNGAAYVLMGPSSDSGNLGDLAVKLSGPSENSNAGYAVDGAGDFNGDGNGDVIVGARWDDTGGTASGTAFVVFGPFTANATLNDADLKLLGEHQDDYAGHSVAGAGDLNGDGKDDVLVGAYGHDFSGQQDGAVYVVLGGNAGSFSLSAAEAVVMGEQVGQQAGVSVAGLGDVDGDGNDDFGLGAWYYQGASLQNGVGYVFHGPGTGP